MNNNSNNMPLFIKNALPREKEEGGGGVIVDPIVCTLLDTHISPYLPLYIYEYI